MPDQSAEPVQPAALASKTSRSTGGVKDTIEQILVAFILAFIFRAFVVEAFVIPTGSMATTLMGAHLRFTCPDCGYTFTVNYTSPNSDDTKVPSNAGQLMAPVYCPNCGYRMDRRQTTNPPVYYGDRILVLKYLYLFEHPHRWDVVVFKAPEEPWKYHYTQNYIKRLVGKPGETLMILDGDIYVRKPNQKQYVVQTKPPDAQNALWRLVYDNDHRPRGLDRGEMPSFVLPWKPISGSGWKLNGIDRGRTFKFTGDKGTLGFNPSADPTAQNISDYLAYDQPNPSRRPGEGFPNFFETPVSDLDLRATYQRTSGSGALELRLTKRADTFIARLTPTSATLLREVNGKRTQIGSPTSISSGSRPVRVELSNADYRVTLRIDDRIVAQTTAAEYAPNIPELLNEYHQETHPPQYPADRFKPPIPTIQIAGDSLHCTVSHLSLWRDVYYYNYNGTSQQDSIRTATPDHPAVLGPDQYFVCGDNSLVSLDARYWPTPIHLPDENLNVPAGRVPGRFMLGKAFSVYWPAGFRPIAGGPNLIPDFADMRFIH